MVDPGIYTLWLLSNMESFWKVINKIENFESKPYNIKKKKNIEFH